MGAGERLVERDGERATLCDAVREAAEGRGGRLVLVEGPAGIGKTALLGVAGAAARDARVLEARGSELERTLPFGVARRLFERLLRHDDTLAERALAGAAGLAADVVGARADGGARPAEAVHHGLFWLTANLAEEQPLVLLIDDLQWADPASLRWVGYLARRVEDLPCAVVCAWRVGEAGADEELLDALRDEASAVIVRPAPLSPAAVATVVRERLAGVDDRVCDACARSSGGNPFLLAELVRTLSSIPAIREGDVSLVRPESVARSVGRRMARLDPQAQRAAEACAVLGDGCELRHVAALAGLSHDETVGAVDALSAADVLSPGRPLRFVHPLVRASLHDRLGAAARAAAHRRAAQVLDAEGEEAGVVALHLLQAEPLGDAWALDRLLAAARAAELRGAADEAIDLYVRALAEPPPADRRMEVLLALGAAEMAALRHGGQARLEEVVARSEDVVQRARAAVILGGFGMRGELEIGLLDRLAELRRALPDDQRELRLRLAAAELAQRTVVDPDAHRAAAEIGELVAGIDGREPAERHLLATWSWWLGATGSAGGPESAELAARALRGQGLFEDGIPSPAVGQAILVLLTSDRADDAQAVIEDGLEHARRRGLRMQAALLSLMRGYRYYLRGDLADAEADMRDVTAASRALPMIELGATAYLARVLVDRAAIDEAEAVLLPRLPDADASSMFVGVAYLALAALRSAQGRWKDAADAALTVGRRQALRGGIHVAVPWRLDAAVALAAAGRREEALRLLADQRPVTARWDVPRLTAHQVRAEALAGEGGELVTGLRDAARRFAAVPARLEEARSRLELGAALRRANARVEAREELRQALDLADRCGALRLVALAQEELAASGARPQRARLSGVASLTASELRVARMAAQGMSNPQIAQALFVTRKTVETHLGAAYRKLDVTGRDALGAALDT